MRGRYREKKGGDALDDDIEYTIPEPLAILGEHLEDFIYKLTERMFYKPSGPSTASMDCDGSAWFLSEKNAHLGRLVPRLGDAFRNLTSQATPEDSLAALRTLGNVLEEIFAARDKVRASRIDHRFTAERFIFVNMADHLAQKAILSLQELRRRIRNPEQFIREPGNTNLGFSVPLPSPDMCEDLDTDISEKLRVLNAAIEEDFYSEIMDPSFPECELEDSPPPEKSSSPWGWVFFFLIGFWLGKIWE